MIPLQDKIAGLETIIALQQKVILDLITKMRNNCMKSSAIIGVAEIELKKIERIVKKVKK